MILTKCDWFRYLNVAAESIDEISRAFCKLIVTLGDHSLVYLVKNINEPLVQNFLQIMMGYTGFPGYFGVDEDESEVRSLGTS